MFNWLFGNKKQEKTEPLPYSTLLNVPLVKGDILDNNIVVRVMKKHPEWTETYVRSLIKEYKVFLHLAANSESECVPTKHVDEIWHEHILFTKDYFEVWPKYLGKLVHHNPEKIDDEKDYSSMFEKTQKTIKEKTKVSKTTLKLKPKKVEKKKTVSSKTSYISKPSFSPTPVYDNPVDYFIMGQMMQQECPSESHPSTSDSCVESSPASSCSSSSCSSSSCSSSSCGGGGGD